MRIGGLYSFKGGREIVASEFANEWAEVQSIIAGINSEAHKTKESLEVTMPGRILYSPRALNETIKLAFAEHQWVFDYRVKCNYSTDFYVGDYQPSNQGIEAFRSMDFVKNQLGVEVQFGKYAFMVYNVCAKMTIFHNLSIINAGIEIVPLKDFANEMSTGVSYFEQIVWDLEQRGTSDIDIPVLVVGITSDAKA